jgi:capsular exopolysaccharide synthesis family protein
LGVPVARRVAPGAAAPAEGGISGRDVLRVIRKRKWLIIISLVVCVGLFVLAQVLWERYAPRYTATAVLEVHPEVQSVIDPQRATAPTTWIETQTKKHARLAENEAVLEQALRADEVKRTNWFSRPGDPLQRLKDDLDVSARPDSGLIDVSMSGDNKAELAEIVNVVAAEAVRLAVESANQGRRKQISDFRTERDDLVAERDRIRTDKSKLQRDAEVPDMSERTNVLTMTLHALAPQVTALELEYAQSEGSLELVKKQIESGEVASLPQVLQSLDLDPSLRWMQTTMLSRQTEYEALRGRLGPQHKTVKDFEARQKALESQVQERQRTLTQEVVKSLLAIAEARKAIVLDRLTKLRDQYRFAEVSVRGLRTTLSRFQQLDARDEDLTRSISRIDSRLMDLRLVEKTNPPLGLRAAARTPRKPSWPRWEIMVPLGVLLGLFVGFGLSFLLEFVDTSIKGPSDIARRVDLPVLGMIPHEDDLEEDIEDLRLAFASHPNSLISEAFRQIRTCLLFSGPASKRRALLVTSPSPEDGRTTVTLNLAASIARSGRKVLVVDANFRQPAIRRLFASCPEAGLSSALVGQAKWRDLVQEIEPNFSVMASGPLPPNPGELLGSEQMSGIIAEMVEQYDQVIFDTAPCLLVTDAPALSTRVDGVILVVRAGANTYGIVQRTREVLTRLGANVIGVVLNAARAMAGGYLRKNYEAFYDYQERAKLPQK